MNPIAVYSLKLRFYKKLTAEIKRFYKRLKRFILEGGALFISRNTSVYSCLESVFKDCGFYDVIPISLKKKDLVKILNEVKPKYVFIHSELYTRVTPYIIGCLLLKLPELNIIVVNLGNSYDDNAGNFIFHGANSYLDLNYGIDKLKEGLKKINAGQIYYSPGVEQQLKNLDEIPNYKKEITKRQWQVLLLICNGHSKDEIIAKLEISRRTVDDHISKLRKLFYASNWVDLSNKAACLGWVRKEDLGRIDIEFNTPQFTSKKKRRRKIIPAHGGALALIECLQSS